jgi:hypothetical protein
MKREKRIGTFGRIVALSCVMLLVLVCSLSFAAATAVSIQSAEVPVGESVTLPIMIADAAEEISCATITISYDPTIIKVTSAKDSGFDALIYNPDIAQGKTTVVVYQTGAQGLSGTITVAGLIFEGLKVGNSALQLQVETLKNNGGVPVEATVESGSITVKSSGGSGGGNGGSGGTITSTPTPSPSPSISPSPIPSPSPSLSFTPAPSPSLSPALSPSSAPGIITVRVDDHTAASGETVTATIRIEGIRGEGLSSAQINLTYDPGVVKVVSAETSDFDEFMSNIGTGLVRMIGYQTGAEGLTGDVTFAQLQLKAVGASGGRSELKVDVTDLIDNKGRMLVEHEDFEVVAGSFTITGEGGQKRIPSCGLASTVAMVIGAYLLVRKRRDY